MNWQTYEYTTQATNTTHLYNPSVRHVVPMRFGEYAGTSKMLKESEDMIEKAMNAYRENTMNLSTQVRKAIEQVAEKTGMSYNDVAEYLLRKALGTESLSVEDAIASLNEVGPKG